MRRTMCYRARLAAADFHVGQVADPGHDRRRDGLVGLRGKGLRGNLDANKGFLDQI